MILLKELLDHLKQQQKEQQPIRRKQDKPTYPADKPLRERSRDNRKWRYRRPQTFTEFLSQELKRTLIK